MASKTLSYGEILEAIYATDVDMSNSRKAAFRNKITSTYHVKGKRDVALQQIAGTVFDLLNKGTPQNMILTMPAHELLTLAQGANAPKTTSSGKKSKQSEPETADVIADVDESAG